MAFFNKDTRPTSYQASSDNNGSDEQYAPPNVCSKASLAVRGEAGSENAVINVQHDGHNIEAGTTSLQDDGTPLLKPRRFLWATFSHIVGLGIVLIMIRINHWASYVFLSPIAFSAFWSAMLTAYEPTTAELKTHRLTAYQRGTRFFNETRRQKQILSLIPPYTLLSCVGLLGSYLTGQAAWKSWFPDIDDLEHVEQSSPALLWFWFAFIVIAGPAILSGLLIGSILARIIMAYQRRKGPPQPATNPPQLPTIVDRPVPVVDCVLSLNSILLFMIIALADGRIYNSSPISFTCIAGMFLCLFWIFWRQIRLNLQLEQIKLCIDWATDVDCTMPDSQATELLTCRQKVQNKYVASAFVGAIPLLCIYFIPQKIDKEDAKSFVILAVCIFLFLNLGLWALWRR